jgi:hypothetical protein
MTRRTFRRRERIGCYAITVATRSLPVSMRAGCEVWSCSVAAATSYPSSEGHRAEAGAVMILEPKFVGRFVRGDEFDVVDVQSFTVQRI